MSPGRERHTIYISDLVWAELRKHTVLQRAALPPGWDSSRIVEYVLDEWLRSSGDALAPAAGLGRRPPSTEAAASAGKRTVFLRPGLWSQLAALARSQGFSVSHLIEARLRQYLDLL